MAVNVSKGENVSLTKQAGAGGLASITVGIGWDARATAGAAFDLDASALALGATRKVLSDKHFVFFNNPSSPDQSIRHAGDNRSGAGDGKGDGDDEQLQVALERLPVEVECVLFAVSIYEASARGQNFGQVRHAYMRLVNDSDGQELARYDLSEDASTEIALLFGEVFRHRGEWRFRALGQGHAGGLAGIARDYGVNV